jgi:hypothetical protein
MTTSPTGIDVDGYSPKHLSYSTIDGYRTCGIRFKLQKVIGVEQRPGLAALGGNAVHLASELYDLALHMGVDLDTIVKMHKAGEL